MQERINVSYKQLFSQNDTLKFYDWTILELEKVKRTELAFIERLKEIVDNE